MLLDEKLISKLNKSEDMEPLILRYQAILLAHGPEGNYLTGILREISNEKVKFN